MKPTLHFEDVHQLGTGNTTQLTSTMGLPNGTVLLIRSNNVKELGDHFIVIIGSPVLKPHGLRPQTLTITAPNTKCLLDKFAPVNGVTILKLNDHIEQMFHSFYGIKVINGQVEYPKELIVNEILNIFDKFRLPATIIDQYEAVGKDKLFDRLLAMVKLWQPLRFSLLGYPFKSGNTRDKVLGDTPDMGEQVSLKTFAYFDQLIQLVYPMGAKFSIVSDGYIFSDVWGIGDDKVKEYTDIVKDMGKSSPITFYDLKDFFSGETNLYNMREKTLAQFGISAEELTKRILTDLNVNKIYTGMIHFMGEELAMQTFPNRSQMQKQAKIIAREMMFRNEAYTAMIQHNFAHDHIRLSIHNSTNDGTKYSFQMIPGCDRHSPWHSALVVHRDSSFETMHKKDAIIAGYELVTVDNKPFYFIEQ